MRLILALLFLSIGSFSFADENIPVMNIESLESLGNGGTNLLLQNPERALEHYQMARATLNRADDAAEFIDFLLYFSEAIAYDMLGQRDECDQALDALVKILDKVELEDSAASDPDTDSDFGEIFQLAMQGWKELAKLAPSPDVREFLTSLVDEMASAE